jgi:hypothetical protein
MKVDHQISFDKEAKFHEALGYLCERYTGFKAKDLKYVLSITCPDFMEGLFDQKEFVCDLRYIGDCSARFTHGQIYKSMTFNGATYEVIDDSRNQMMIGSCYFTRLSDMESAK